MTEAPVPRLLYLADVPVESSQHGSALLFRLLDWYPPDRLLIIERADESTAARRLPGVSYLAVPYARRLLLNSRLHGPYSAWLSFRAPSDSAQVISRLDAFQPEAVLTVGHGFGWLTAAAVAARLQVPLHLIIHDDWPRLAAITPAFRRWLDRRFGEVYRAAASRLCVSPFMAEEYSRRYGAAGQVIYPSRARDSLVADAKPARQLGAQDALVIGYGGNSGAEVMTGLRQLAAASPAGGARLEVFGPFSPASQRELLACTPAVTFHGFVPNQQMIAALREQCDVLFVPMTFGPGARANQVVAFPSKLADYTATGLPLLIHAPAYASAVRWARAHGDAAEIVDQPGPAPLQGALDRLRDPSWRGVLANRSVAAGHRCFDAAAAQAVFRDVIAP